MGYSLHENERFYLFPITSAVFVSLALFYVDEGYYNLSWTLDPRNWLIFGCFVLGLFVGQAIISAYCFSNLSGWPKKMLILLLGLPLGVLIVAFLLYLGSLVTLLIDSLS